MSRPLVHIELLGGFSLSNGGKTISSLPRTTTSLLAYLIVHRSRTQTRDLLAGRFWSDLPDGKARKRLSNALWQMRKALAEVDLPNFIVTSVNTVQIESEFAFDIDSERFDHDLDRVDEMMRRGRIAGDAAEELSSALERFPGEFLAGFYDDWIDAERSRVNERYSTGLQQLARLYKARSDYESALRILRLLLSYDPLEEENHREVMRICALIGDTGAAERHYQSCRQILTSELGVEPSEETELLINRIRADAPAVVRPARNDPTSIDRSMVGRAKERSVLLGRADDLHAGSGGLVLIEGDAGLGKSRLVEDFVEGVEWRRLRLLSAGHTHLSSMRPYDGLRLALAPATVGLRAEHLAEVLDPVWIQQAAAVLPGLENLGRRHRPASALRPSEEPSRMSEALARVILAQGALGPTVIVLEDVHWCDKDSFDVLSHLGGRLAQAAVLVVLTYRRFEAEQSEHVWSSLAKLDTQPSTSRVMLQPLNLYELQDLVSGLHGPGALTDATAGQLLEKTGGNPLFALESYRSSTLPTSATPEIDESARNGADGVPLNERLDLVSFSDRLPTSLEAALGRRLDALDPVTANVVHTAAAFSEPFDAVALSEVTGLARSEVLEALSAAVDAGFISEQDGSVCQFSHDYSRDLVYNSLSEAKRRRIHGEIYGWMEDLEDARIERLAFHACLSDRWDRGYVWHVAAADEALEMNAFRTAAENFAKADFAAGEAGLELVETASVLLRYEAALDVLGDRRDQEMVLKRLSEESLPVDLELQLAERRCWYMANTDEPAEAIRLALLSAEKASENGLPPFSFLTIAGTALIWSGDAKGAIAPLSEVVDRCDDGSDRLAAQTMLGKAYVDLLELGPAEEKLTAALESARHMGDIRAQIETLGHKAVLDWHNGLYEQAEMTQLESLELSQAIGYRHGEGLNLVNLATLNGTLGRGGQAFSYFVRATDVFAAHGNRRGEAIVQHNLAELHHLLLGDDESAARLANSAAVYFRSINSVRFETLALCTISSIDARQSRTRRARQRMISVLDRTIEHGDEVSQLEVLSTLGSIELANKRYDAALEYLDTVLKLAEDHNVDDVVANTFARRGVAMAGLGNDQEAVICAERAVALNAVGNRQPHITAWHCGRVFEASELGELATEQFKIAYERLTVSLDGVSDDLVDQSWSAVPEHQAILIDYESRFEKLLEVSLPKIAAGLGRPLRPQDYVMVEWAVSEPSDWIDSNPSDRRRARLRRLAVSAVEQGGVARVSDLAAVLGVSDRTIKRDLVILRDAGEDVPTRKGALEGQK